MIPSKCDCKSSNDVGAMGVGAMGDGAIGDGAIGVGVGVGVATTTLTPLLHTSFLPLFMHVYLYPLTEVVAFNFAHTEPAFTEAIAFVGINRERATVSAVSGFFIGPVSG